MQFTMLTEAPSRARLAYRLKPAGPGHRKQSHAQNPAIPRAVGCSAERTPPEGVGEPAPLDRVLGCAGKDSDTQA